MLSRALLLLGLLATFAFAAPARADDGGVDASVDAADDAPPEGIRPTEVPDNWGCATGPSQGRSGERGVLCGVLAVAFVVLVRRRRRTVAAALAAALALASANVQADVPATPAASATAEGDALREVRSDEPPMRRFTLALSPLSPMIGRWGGSLELLLASHHAIGLSGAWVHCRTNEDSNNVFTGGIGELGYRYYFGANGARGFFIGPSFVFGAFSAVPERGSSQSFFDLGGALDAGFSALVFDRVLFALGGGIQYTAPTATFPAQELPASIYARPGVRPRLLLAIGVAF